MQIPPNSQGTKVLLEGPAGTGKTFAIGTLADWAQENGLQVNVLFVEAGLETLLGYWRDRGRQPPPALAYHLVQTKPLELKDLVMGADESGRRNYAQITAMVDPNRATNNPYAKILRVLEDFEDQATGTSRGNAGSWGADTILVVDSLSELAQAAMKMIIGNRPTAAPPDYMVAQNNLMNFVRWLTQSPFHLVMIAHVERQLDEILGTGLKIMPKVIGKAIANEFPQLFSDVILSVREGTVFYWDTANSAADLKTRNLPIAAKQRPDFAVIMQTWAKRFIH